MPESDPARDRQYGNDLGDSRAIADGYELAHPERVPNQLRIIDAWLTALHGRVQVGQASLETLANARRRVRPWLAWLEAHSCDAPTATDLQAFLNTEASERRPRGLNALLDYLRACYRWAATRGLWTDITIGLVSSPKDYPAVPVLEPQQIEELLTGPASAGGSALLTRRNRALVSLLYETGLRPGQLRLLTVGDLTPTGIRTADRSVLPLSPCCRRLVAAYLQERQETVEHAPLIATVTGGERRLSTLSMRLACLRIFEAAGLVARTPDSDGQGRVVQPGAWSASCLRRSRTWAAGAGGANPDGAVQASRRRRRRETVRELRRYTPSTVFAPATGPAAAQLRELVGQAQPPPAAPRV